MAKQSARAWVVITTVTAAMATACHAPAGQIVRPTSTKAGLAAVRDQRATLVNTPLHEDARSSRPATWASRPPARAEPAGAASRVETSAAARAHQAAQVVDAVDGIAPETALGVEVFDRDTQSVVARVAPHHQFHAASVVKLLIAIDALQKQPSPDVASQVHRMLTASDDSIADALWQDDGGPAIVSRMISLLGLSDTEPPSDPAQWGDTLITAADVVTTYRWITDRLPQAQRDLILDSLANATPQAADGLDQYFGIPRGMADVP
jgi:hypothetical protein